MKKYLLALALVFSAFLSARSQTLEEIEAEILSYMECVKQFSAPDYHSGEYVLSNGKRVSVMEQTDFDRFVFSSIDAFVENMDRFFNESTYFRPMRRMLMDKQDLSDWEFNSAKTISREYFKSPGNCFHIASHGLMSPDGNSDSILMGGVELNAEETSELILKTMLDVGQAIINAKHEPFTIVLHSCGSGRGENSFAARLSKALAKEFDNVAVVAAPDVVYCTMDEDGNYSERISSESAIRAGRYDSDRQNWMVFKDGRSYMTGTKDYADTVDKYLKSNDQNQ